MVSTPITFSGSAQPSSGPSRTCSFAASSVLENAVSASYAISVTMQVAIEHHACGRLSEAAALYAEVQRADPENAHVVFLLGLIALTVGNLHAAERLLATAAQRMPDAAYAHRAYGQVLSRRGRLGQAVASYWQAMVLDPENASAYVDVAEALIAIKPTGGNDALASSCFRRARQLETGSSAAKTKLPQQRPLAKTFPAVPRATHLEASPVQ